MRCPKCHKDFETSHFLLRSDAIVNTRRILIEKEGMNKETAELAVEQIVRPHLQSMRLALGAFVLAWYRAQQGD